MALLETLQQISEQQGKAAQPMELVIGTVTRVNPIEITRDVAQAPIKSQVLYLTEGVIPKQLTISSHRHKIPERDPPNDYVESTSLQMSVSENGAGLSSGTGSVLLNRALAVGDRVLMLSVERGQKFVVLSRVYQ